MVYNKPIMLALAFYSISSYCEIACSYFFVTVIITRDI